MTKRTTADWQALLDGWVHVRRSDTLLGSRVRSTQIRKQDHASYEAVAEVVRLRRALEEQLKELSDELEAEGVETHDDIDGTWPSMQRYGELSEMIDQRNFLTLILEGGDDE